MTALAMKARAPVPFSSEDDDVIVMDSLGIRHFDPTVGSPVFSRAAVPPLVNPKATGRLNVDGSKKATAPLLRWDITVNDFSLVKDELEFSRCRRVAHPRAYTLPELPVAATLGSLGRRT